MLRLIALQEFTYATIPLKVGDRFIAESDEDARLLKGFGKARDDEYAPSYRTSAMKPEGKRGRYRRSDVRADED